MISYISGVLTEADGDGIVVEGGSVGYDIRVPLSLLENLPPLGSHVKIYTYLRVQEDAMTLYGFASRQDLRMFRRLLGVNGVGPKGGLAILSALGPEKLRLAILSGDARAISRAPGIGLKTAQRVILDLKDKVDPQEILSPGAADAAGGGSAAGAGAAPSVREAVDALVALGYSPAEAAGAVRRVEGAENLTAEEVLRASLRHLAF